jgi:hypothetical protein
VDPEAYGNTLISPQDSRAWVEAQSLLRPRHLGVYAFLVIGDRGGMRRDFILHKIALTWLKKDFPGGATRGRDSAAEDRNERLWTSRFQADLQV